MPDLYITARDATLNLYKFAVPKSNIKHINHINPSKYKSKLKTLIPKS